MEHMATSIENDSSQVMSRITDQPIKGEATLDREALDQQAQFAAESLATVNYEKVRGTCVDERPRVGLSSGEAVTEPRPSAPGGPNIYGLYVMELSGSFANAETTATERLRQVTRDLNRNDVNIRSGGHKHCAAAAGFGSVIENIATNSEIVKAYAEANKEDYDPELMEAVIRNAEAVVASKRYEGWNGEVALAEVLGDEAGEAIEELADVPHEAKTLVRTRLAGKTVDQTKLHNLAGADSFVNDDAYEDAIEDALASGPHLTDVKRLMEHAREAVLVGVALAVPNDELHQITITA